MNCDHCNKPVPTWLVTACGGVQPLWCSGRCLRLSFTRHVGNLLRCTLTPAQFQEVTARADPRLPALESPQQIREAITYVTDALLADRVQPKQASILLYALQTAISTLRLAADSAYPDVALAQTTEAIGFHTPNPTEGATHGTHPRKPPTRRTARTTP